MMSITSSKSLSFSLSLQTRPVDLTLRCCVLEARTAHLANHQLASLEITNSIVPLRKVIGAAPAARLESVNVTLEKFSIFLGFLSKYVQPFHWKPPAITHKCHGKWMDGSSGMKGHNPIQESQLAMARQILSPIINFDIYLLSNAALQQCFLSHKLLSPSPSLSSNMEGYLTPIS